MKVLNKNYTGCTAVVRSATGDMEVHTSILLHDSNYMTLQLRSRLEDMAIGDQLSILIMQPDCIHEYSGILRKSSSIGSTLTLFNGKLTDHRTAVRYTVNLPATVEKLIVGGQRYPLCNALPVLVVNLSTSGILLRAKPNFFDAHTSMELKLPIGGNETILDATVVRTHQVSLDIMEYGAQFINEEAVKSNGE